MKRLLDVNLLVAWGWADHADHGKVSAWLRLRLRDPKSVLYTSSITRLGFVRVSVQRSRGGLIPADAGALLDTLLADLGKHHKPLADDGPGTVFPSWCRGASQTTDAHLLALAASHGAKLATLDTGIPGAELIG
jgi:uncharacterized protein